MTTTKIKRYFLILIKFFLAVLLGLTITLFFVQNDPWINKSFSESLKKTWKRDFGCNVDCEIESINVFNPSIHFKHISMSSSDGSWSWKCAPFSVQFSWLALFLNGVIEFYVSLDDVELQSHIDSGGVPIWSHIGKIFKSSSFKIPTILKALIVKKGKIALTEISSETKLDLDISSFTKNIYGDFKTKIYFKEGSLWLYKRHFLHKISGPVSFDVRNKSGKIFIDIHSNCLFESPYLPDDKPYFLTGKWGYDQGVFSIKNQDGSFAIDPIKLYFLGEMLFLEVNVASRLKDILGFLSGDLDSLAGDCFFQLRSEFGPLSYGTKGSLVLKDVNFKGVDCFSLARLEFRKTKKDYKGKLSVIVKDGIVANGDVNYDGEQSALHCNITNETEIAIPGLSYWKIDPKKIDFSFCYDKSKTITGAYHFLAGNNALHTNFDLSGDVFIKNGDGFLRGKLNEDSYNVNFSILPQFRVKKCFYKDKSGSSLFAVKACKENDNRLFGSMKFPLIKSFTHNYWGYDLKGDGDLKLYGVIKDDSLLFHLNFDNGSVSLPGIYNFLHKVKLYGKIDPFDRSIIVKNAFVHLHKGDVSCKKAVIKYDDAYKPAFVYAPFIFRDCLLNYNNDVFALVSGRMLFAKKKEDNPILKGYAIIERSQLKRNIFSKKSDETVVSSAGSLSDASDNILCDISVFNKNPVRIKMSSLEASANLDVSIKKNLFNPEISGHIDFISGSVSFPYKPLYITKGSIYFLPHQTDGPMLELIAKNKINKYNVSLCMSGSFSNQQISFESAPPLSEEQIIALLIAGSAQESLNVVMPALIMQNLKSALFGADQPESSSESRFNRLFKPFKNVSIIPSFTDQSGRGGLRGAIEISLGERWRAFVQKNFSLSEDTRFELEYLFADDISFRGMRTENGDIGGEVEMRWNF